jgi:hypothetical protein
LKSTVGSEEGWQVVWPRQCRVGCRAPSEAAKPHSPLLPHRCAGQSALTICRLFTRCFNCHGLQYHLRDCKRPEKSHALHVVGDSEACSNVDGWRFNKARHDDSGARPASQATRSTLMSHGVGDSFGALTSTPYIASGFPEPNLTFPVASVSLF